MKTKLVIALLIAILGAGFDIAPVSGATLFGLVDTGELFVSNDGGATWTLRAALAVSDAVGIGAAETSDDIFLATRSGLVYRSADAGVVWTAVGTVSASDIVDLVIRPKGGILLLSGTGTVWKSADNGVSYTAIAALTASNHVSLCADASDNLYILTQTGEVTRSEDDGVSWTTVGAVTTSEAVEIRAASSELFVLNGTGDIARSTDQGATWTTIGTLSQVHMRSLTLDGSALVAVTAEGLTAFSSDGTSWSWVGSINQLAVVALGNDTPTSTGVRPQGPPRLEAVRLKPLWPNPVGSQNDLITFSFSLPEDDGVSIEIYDVKGRLINRRPREEFPGSREHVVSWKIGEPASGVYYFRLATDRGLIAHRKLTVVR